MKRLARFFGLIGGIGAIVYVMRERLVSLTAPHEPEPPRFKPMPATHKQTPDSDGGAGRPDGYDDDLTTILGIGPAYAAKLADAGVSGFADLAGRDPVELAEAIALPETKVADWIREASEH